MDTSRFRNIGRRDLLKAAGGLALLASVNSHRVHARASFDAYPFSLGVASGDPWPDGFVLWTRVAPKPLEPGGGMPPQALPVEWEVAEDAGFKRIVRKGIELARPELAHSVHVEVSGLEPAWRYWYRFRAGPATSVIGTARTAPSAGTINDRLRIGVAGCQHYEFGLFTAYRHLSELPDIDLVFHYGDYIYEGTGATCRSEGGTRNCVRAHIGGETYSLDDYRRRYGQYKADGDLQAAHAAAAFVMSYDDHEVDNDWAGDEDQDGTPAEAFVLRRFAAMQAWYEHMPVRRAQLPALGKLQMYRRLDFGALLRLHVLDTRQYRTNQLCNDDRNEHCRSSNDPAPATMLGADQEAWLGAGLDHKARWNLLAQQVMVMPFNYPQSRAAGRVNQDSWSGYPAARERLVQQIRERDLRNVVIATGDVHKHHVGTVPLREGDLDGPAAATEFVCTSISSDGDGQDLPQGWEQTRAANPHCRLINARRGFQLFEIDRKQWRTDVWTVDKVTVAGGHAKRLSSYTVEPDVPVPHE